MKKYLKLMRIHHYIKNILIFLPLIFSGYLLLPSYLFQVIKGFIVFCILTSIIYIINDIKDVDNDRNHSEKCKRPLASGAISILNAKILLCTLVIIIFILSLTLNPVQCIAFIYLISYFLINLSYSMGLKNVPILDIAILVSGFLIRVLFGASLAGIEVSNWLYLTIMAISFYLGLGKRRNEIKQQKSTRNVLKYYTYDYLDKNMYISMACAFIFYALWCVDITTISKYSSNILIWTIPLVILIGMKYSLNIESSSDGDPVEVILHDKILIGLICIYALIVFGLLYLI